MATFDEKEFLIEDIVSSVKANISRKKDASVKYRQDMLNDFREIDDFRFKLTQKNRRNWLRTSSNRRYVEVAGCIILTPDRALTVKKLA